MVICPLCGGVFTKNPGTGMTDESLYHPEDVLLQGCLCHYSVNAMERIIVNFEERLNEDLNERFPGMKISQIKYELRKMDRHSPLRVSLVKRIDGLERGQKRLLELKKKEISREKSEEGKNDIIEKSTSGESISLQDWIVSFTK